MKTTVNDYLGRQSHKKSFISLSQTKSRKKNNNMENKHHQCERSFNINLLKGSSLFYIESECKTHKVLNVNNVKKNQQKDKAQKLSRIINYDEGNTYIFESMISDPYKSKPINLKKDSSRKKPNKRIKKGKFKKMINDQKQRQQKLISSTSSIKEVKMKMSDIIKLYNRNNINRKENDEIQYISDIISNHRNALITKKILDAGIFHKNSPSSSKKSNIFEINRTKDTDCNIIVETYKSYITPPIEKI